VPRVIVLNVIVSNVVVLNVIVPNVVMVSVLSPVSMISNLSLSFLGWACLDSSDLRLLRRVQGLHQIQVSRMPRHRGHLVHVQSQVKTHLRVQFRNAFWWFVLAVYWLGPRPKNGGIKFLVIGFGDTSCTGWKSTHLTSVYGHPFLSPDDTTLMAKYRCP